MTLEKLYQELRTRDKGVLKEGRHTAKSGEYCFHEFDNALRGREFSDEPIDFPDLRKVNDGFWNSDEERTEHLLPVMAALWDWSEWSAGRQARWVTKVTVKLVRQIISELPMLSEELRVECRNAENAVAAENAARSAAR